jgi:hypothetical protein
MPFVAAKVLSPYAKLQFFDNNGVPLNGGKLYTYSAGTSNLLGTYADSSGSANANPVVLDSSGRATVYLDVSQSYKFVLQTSAGVTVWTQDNVSAGLSTITIQDSNLTIQNAGDTTKQAKFDASAIATGTTRTYTLPNINDTLATLTASQTLTNKTISAPTISGAASMTGTVVVSAADAITENGVIVPQALEVSFHAQTAAACVNQSFFIANTTYQVTAVRFVASTAEATAGSLYALLEKDTSTTAPGSGTGLQTDNTNLGFNCKSTANTVQVGTLTGTTANLQLAAGDRLAIKFSASATELAGVTITVQLKRI